MAIDEYDCLPDRIYRKKEAEAFAKLNPNYGNVDEPCERCKGSGWICEMHNRVSWHACECGEPGMPCPECNDGSKGDGHD